MKRIALASLVALLACGGETTPPRPPPLTTAAPSASSASSAADPLGPRPPVATPAPFEPPAPVVYTQAGGLTVWLLERHGLPIVSTAMTVPTGASSDPRGKGGLSHVTANMLDEGAGKLGALELARAIDALGASLGTDSNADASFVSLTVEKKNLAKAFALFGDVVARPRFDPPEFKRVHDLWLNDLRSRASDPDATARVVFRVALWGPDHPYGHPWDGTIDSAKAVSLADVRTFYAQAYRPDRATLVAVGDVTREELAPMLDASFASWKAPRTAAPAPIAPAPPKGPWPRFVLVDRADAPQAVIAVVRPGPAASDPATPALWRTNNAIGASFTSRLNQDLREEHGWSYGAHSRASSSRGPGMVVSYASVVTQATGEALRAMLADLREFATRGMTNEEIDKTRSQARSELVSVYESVEAAASRLAADASLGLGPDFEAKASVARDRAGREDLDRLAKLYYDPSDAIVVVVGPRTAIAPQIAGLGLPEPELRDADGRPAK